MGDFRQIHVVAGQALSRNTRSGILCAAALYHDRLPLQDRQQGATSDAEGDCRQLHGQRNQTVSFRHRLVRQGHRPGVQFREPIVSGPFPPANDGAVAVGVPEQIRKPFGNSRS